MALLPLQRRVWSRSGMNEGRLGRSCERGRPHFPAKFLVLDRVSWAGRIGCFYFDLSFCFSFSSIWAGSSLP